MNIQFTKGNWEDRFDYAYTCRFPFAPKLVQEADCVRNSASSGMKDGFDYTSILLKDKYGKGTEMSLTCSFEEYGAPLLVFPKSLWQDEEGHLRYGDYHEVVLYKDGINVWDLYMVNGEVKWNLLFSSDFRVQENAKQTFQVKLLDKGLKITVGDRAYYVRIGNLPAEVYVGITACENINRIYEFSITDRDA